MSKQMIEHMVDANERTGELQVNINVPRAREKFPGKDGEDNRKRYRCVACQRYDTDGVNTKCARIVL